jgi:SacI homology domain
VLIHAHIAVQSISVYREYLTLHSSVANAMPIYFAYILCGCTHCCNVHTCRGTGGLRRVTTAVGIVGFVRFLGCFYLTLITQRKRVGAIGGNLIYAVRGTETFPVRRETAGGISSSSEEGSSTVGGLQGDAQLPHNAFVNVWSKVSAVALRRTTNSSQ